MQKYLEEEMSVYLRKDQRAIIENAVAVLLSHYDQLTPEEQKTADDFVQLKKEIDLESQRHSDAAVKSMRQYLSTEKGKEQNRLRSKENKLKAKQAKAKKIIWE